MRTFTGIGPDNHFFFEPLLPGDGFSKETLMIGAIEDGEAAGALAAVLEEGIASILSLMVSEGLRRRGIGRELLLRFLDFAEENGSDGVMAVFPRENPEPEAFFRAMGFWIEDGEALYTIGLRELLASEKVKRYLSFAEKGNCKSLAVLNEAEREKLDMLLLEAGFSLQDETDLKCDPDLSFFLLDGQEAAGVILAGREEQDLFIYLLHDRSPSSPDVPLILMANVLEAAGRLPYLKKLRFTSERESVISLAQRMADGPGMLSVSAPVRKAVMPLIARNGESPAGDPASSKVRQPGNGPSAGREAEKAPGEAEKASGEAEKASGEAEKASGEAEKASGEAEKASGEAEKAPGEAEKAPGEEEKASREAEKASGETEKASGEAEKASREAEEDGEEDFAPRQYRTTLGELLRRPLFRKMKGTALLARPLSSLRPMEFQLFMEYALANSHLGDHADLWEYSPDCSCVIERNGKTESFLLIRLEPEGSVVMDDLYLKVGQGKDFYELVTFAVKQLSMRIPEEATVLYHCRRPEGAKLVEYFYREAEYTEIGSITSE